MKTKPKFYIKNKPQKADYLYEDILNHNMLVNICKKITSQEEYEIVFDNTGYNKGRLAILEYGGYTHYISLSQQGKVEGRNSYFQSLTTALVLFKNEQPNNHFSRIHFYFLVAEGNFETEYHLFMYRLMATAGVNFLNENSFLKSKIYPFITSDDLVNARNNNSKKNNNSTYITKNEDGIYELYAKTYGANKKESVLMAFALSSTMREDEFCYLYEMVEQDLKTLPQPDILALKKLYNVKIITTNRALEEREYEANNSLRSPKFIASLLARLGPKKCSLCDCQIPEIIQGAHILPVSRIKEMNSLSFEEKLNYATDGKNGIWLCMNHHKLFDDGIIIFQITSNKSVYVFTNESVTKSSDNIKYIRSLTNNYNLTDNFNDKELLQYLHQRNSYCMKSDLYTLLTNT